MPDANPPIRLHLRIARSGLCSRRAAEELIRQGRVAVNGTIVTDMGIKVTEEDKVQVDDQRIGVAKPITLVLNKPKGYVTSLSDPRAGATVAELLPSLGTQVKPVGRLDRNTEGLLVFTNEGELAKRLTHPSYGVEKEYWATVRGVPDDKDFKRLEKGIRIEGKPTAPAKVRLIASERDGSSAKVGLIIHEGRKHQVRLMMEAVGHPVLTLKRVKFGNLRVKGMQPAEVRILSEQELNALKLLVGLGEKPVRPQA